MKNRRSFLWGLTLGALSAPLVVEAQQAGKVYRIGILGLGVQDKPDFDAFRQRLRELGYEEGRNLVIEFRGHRGEYGRLSALSGELVSPSPDVIVVTGPRPAAAVKAATTTIPIVFAVVADPVDMGLVSSLARPGGNVTGLSTLVHEEFIEKQLQLLHEAVPSAARMAVLMNPTNVMNRSSLPQTVAASAKLKLNLQILEASTADELESAFKAAIRGHADAIQVYGDGLTIVHRARIAELTAKARLPAIYLFKENVADGGLMSYGPSRADLVRRAAGYVDKILKGAKPGDLPVERPTKFELVINLKTAKALGLTIPPSLLLRADQVIE